MTPNPTKHDRSERGFAVAYVILAGLIMVVFLATWGFAVDVDNAQRLSPVQPMRYTPYGCYVLAPNGAYAPCYWAIDFRRDA